MSCKGVKKDGQKCLRRVKNTEYCHLHLSQGPLRRSVSIELCPICCVNSCNDTGQTTCNVCNKWICNSCTKQLIKPECPMCRHPLQEILTEDVLQLIEANHKKYRREQEQEEFNSLLESFRRNGQSVQIVTFSLSNECVCTSCMATLRG